MKYVKVLSTDIDKVAIEGSDLIIKFNSGGTYSYKGAAKEFQNLINASSKGKYFHTRIKNNYEYEKIEIKITN